MKEVGVFAGQSVSPAITGRADSKPVTGILLAGAVSMGGGRRNRPLLVLESASAATDLDLIT